MTNKSLEIISFFKKGLDLKELSAAIVSVKLDDQVGKERNF